MSIPTPKGDRTITVSTGLFINNEFVPSVDSQELLTYVFIRKFVKTMIPKLLNVEL